MASLNNATLLQNFMEAYQNLPANLQAKANDWLTEEKEKSKICSLAPQKGLMNLECCKIAELVRKRLPNNTFESICVERTQYPFQTDIKANAIKITLTRTSGSPILLAPVAFFSALFKADSIYLRTYSKTGIKDHLLASTRLDQLTEIEHEEIIKDIQAVYHQYKSIEIFVPEELNCEAIIEITDASRLISFSINSARALRKSPPPIQKNVTTSEKGQELEMSLPQESSSPIIDKSLQIEDIEIGKNLTTAVKGV